MQFITIEGPEIMKLVEVSTIDGQKIDDVIICGPDNHQSSREYYNGMPDDCVYCQKLQLELETSSNQCRYLQLKAEQLRTSSSDCRTNDGNAFKPSDQLRNFQSNAKR